MAKAIKNRDDFDSYEQYVIWQILYKDTVLKHINNKMKGRWFK